MTTAAFFMSHNGNKCLIQQSRINNKMIDNLSVFTLRTESGILVLQPLIQKGWRAPWNINRTECDNLLILLEMLLNWKQYKAIICIARPRRLGGSCGMIHKHLFGTFHWWTGLLVTAASIMIEYVRGILERLCQSQARMWQDSPPCQTHVCIKYITTWAQDYFIKCCQ